MVALQLPNTRTNVLVAAAIAHRNGGYFRQNDPPGQITVEGTEGLTIERELIEWALGRPCPDDLWEMLTERPRGHVVRKSDDLIVLE